ncbi:hypothetical protein N7522_009406 [Penicillium canescens]|nr:hypothetical protein N7522_009406 [Penicillium canescens]
MWLSGDPEVGLRACYDGELLYYFHNRLAPCRLPARALPKPPLDLNRPSFVNSFVSSGPVHYACHAACQLRRIFWRVGNPGLQSQVLAVSSPDLFLRVITDGTIVYCVMPTRAHAFPQVSDMRILRLHASTAPVR